MTTPTDYAGNYIYENGDLQFFNHAEGYVETNTSGGYDYIYQYQDHLGNIRLSYKNVGSASNPSLEIQEENNYYPFGLKHKGYNNTQNGRNHKYGFGGKEEQDDDVAGTQLDWLDFGARNYDASIGRWMNLDPLAEQMRRHSPYNYAFNNPLRFIDPDGMSPNDVIITGSMADEALNELQASVSNEITLKKDKEGNVTYTRNGEGPLSKDTQQLVDAIDDHSVKVNVNSNDTSITSDGESSFIGGAFLGNKKVGENNDGESIISTTQDVNPEVLKTLDDTNGNPGASMLHEVVESYLGGKEAQDCGYSCVAPASANNIEYVYENSHASAPPQGGDIYVQYFDSKGNPSGKPTKGGQSMYYTLDKNNKPVGLQVDQY